MSSDVVVVGGGVVAGDAAGLAEAERLAVALARFGNAVEPPDPGMLATLEPCLAPDLAGGYRQEEGFQLDPTAATLAFATAAPPLAGAASA